MRQRLGLLFFVTPLAIALAACGGGDDTSTGTSAATTATTAGAGGGATTGAGGATTGVGGAGVGGGGTGGSGGAVDFVPTPADTQFGSDAPMPKGEQILFNDWNATPNEVRSMQPDGSGAVDVFHAFRVWSMGASHDGAKIAFASGDPQQKAHFGIDVYDAIQWSWLYDDDTQQATLLAHGNINDECHTFSADDASVYVCRRYDFTNDGMSKGYRVGRIDVANEAFSFLTDDLYPNELDLYPQPNAAESSMLYTRIVIQNGNQQRIIAEKQLPAGASTDVVADAGDAVVSPDGTRMVFADYSTNGTLWASDLDGKNRVEVVAKNGSSPRWSPDGKRVVYLLWDDAASCSHVEVANADGSQVDAPTRIRDCGDTNEFITDVAWIVR